MSSEASVTALLLENARLRSKLAELQAALSSSHSHQPPSSAPSAAAAAALPPLPASLPPSFPPLSSSSSSSLRGGSVLSNASILRYSRHLLLSELGNHPVSFVEAVQCSGVLVIGAGGLGCPALLYLAAAGVGRLGVVDGDVVDPSNLPRQVLYDDRHLGQGKAEAAAARVRLISPQCAVEWHSTLFSPGNAESLCRGYDVLLDCSDNVATRYLCNDISVLLGIPCVSASALRLEGQLSVYGSRTDGGPCYRCLFPMPVAAHLVTNCNEGGILNAVTGVMGTLQAMEALKCIAQLRQAKEQQTAGEDHSAQRPSHSAYRCPSLSTLSGRLLLFDGCSSTFRSVKLRGRSPQCAVCGDDEWRCITLATLQQQHYTALCSADSPAAFNDRPSMAEAVRNQPALLQVVSVSVHSLASRLQQQSDCQLPFVLLDVRPSLQFDIAHLPHSLNVPRDQLTERWPDVQRAVEQAIARAGKDGAGAAHRQPAATAAAEMDSLDGPRCQLFVLCRRGVDSLYAARWIGQQHNKQQQQQQSQREQTAEGSSQFKRLPIDVLNVEGGLMAWSEYVDSQFPLY